MTMPVEKARPASDSTLSVRPSPCSVMTAKKSDIGIEAPITSRARGPRRKYHRPPTASRMPTARLSSTNPMARRTYTLASQDSSTKSFSFASGPGIQFGDRFLDLVDDLDGVGIGRALQRDVVRRHAAAIREPPRLDVLGADVGHVTQVQRTIVTPADDEVAKVGNGLAARNPHGELTPPDIGESGGDVACRNYRLRQPLWREAERSEPVRIEAHVHFARPPALEADARHAFNTGQPRFDHLFDELLVFDGNVRHLVARQRSKQQRSRILGLEVIAAEHLRFVGIGRQRRQRVETRNDVQHDARHVGADFER